MSNNTIKLPKGKLTTAITAFLLMAIFSKQIFALGTQRTIAHSTGNVKTNLIIQPVVAQPTDSGTQKITAQSTNKVKASPPSVPSTQAAKPKVITVHHAVQKSDDDRGTGTSE